jgi:hypothetical protein
VVFSRGKDSQVAVFVTDLISSAKVICTSQCTSIYIISTIDFDLSRLPSYRYEGLYIYISTIILVEYLNIR